MYPIKTDKIKVTSGYGERTYIYRGKKVKDFHKGIDLIGGEEIVATADGKVVSICNKGEQYGTGCYVRIEHSNGLHTLYFHLKSGSVTVKKSQKVTKGQVIGIIGKTGKATGVHVHYQIDKGSSATAIDPTEYVLNGKEIVEEAPITPEKPKEESKKDDTPVNESLLLLVRRTIRGDFGNGNNRKTILVTRYGKDTAKEVQRQVNLNVKDNNWNWDKIHLYK